MAEQSGEVAGMFSAAQVAKMLGISRQRIYEIIAAGLLEACDLHAGKKDKKYLRIAPEALDAYLAKTKTTNK